MRGWGINRLFLGKELGILKSDLWITLEGGGGGLLGTRPAFVA